MSIKVEIIADSISTAGVRLTTFSLRYPRIIHGELLTHRMFSRNSSSSRAIPIQKMIDEVKSSPFVPEVLLKNQKGMQAGEPLSEDYQQYAKREWLIGRDMAVRTAQILKDLSIHKEYVNRVLEPFSYISVVLTATDFNNWFTLRYHSAAQPEIHALAKEMYTQYEERKFEVLEEGAWHLPYISKEELYKDTKENIITSVARCARVSYKTHEGKDSTFEEDQKLYDRLVGSTPVHASPAEHQAMATGDPNIRSGNFQGWIQYRQTIPNNTSYEFLGED